jgi:hypothetical protein
MKKNIFLLIFLCHFSSICAQEIGLSIKPILGAKMHMGGLPTIQTAGIQKVLTAPSLGIELSHAKVPIDLLLRYNFTYGLVAYSEEIEALFGQSDILEKRTQFDCLLQYSFRDKNYIRIGVFNMFREIDIDYFVPGGPKNYRGLLFGYARDFDWLNIEIASKVDIDPSFAALVGLVQYSLSFSYRLGNQSKSLSKFNRKFSLRGLLGARLFPLINLRVLENESPQKVGVAPVVGIELMHRKSHLSLNMDKDFYIGFNGGSPVREIPNYISTFSLGVKYHHLLKSSKHLRYGLCWSLVEDLDKAGLSSNASPELFALSEKLVNYGMKGIGVNFSYEILKNCDIEIRHTFPVVSFDESLFNPLRSAIGVIYRLGGKQI